MIKIDPEAFYSKTEIIKMLNIADSTFTIYRNNGLKTHPLGKGMIYTQGKELIQFILNKEGRVKPEGIRK